MRYRAPRRRIRLDTAASRKALATSILCRPHDLKNTVKLQSASAVLTSRWRLRSVAKPKPTQTMRLSHIPMTTNGICRQKLTKKAALKERNTRKRQRRRIRTMRLRIPKVQSVLVPATLRRRIRRRLRLVQRKSARPLCLPTLHHRARQVRRWSVPLHQQRWRRRSLPQQLLLRPALLRPAMRVAQLRRWTALRLLALRVVRSEQP